MLSKIRNISPEYMISFVLSLLLCFVPILPIILVVLQIMMYVIIAMGNYQNYKWAKDDPNLYGEKRLKESKEELKSFLDKYRWWMTLIPGFLIIYAIILKVIEIKQEYKNLK